MCGACSVEKAAMGGDGYGTGPWGFFGRGPEAEDRRWKTVGDVGAVLGAVGVVADQRGRPAQPAGAASEGGIRIFGLPWQTVAIGGGVLAGGAFVLSKVL